MAKKNPNKTTLELANKIIKQYKKKVRYFNNKFYYYHFELGIWKELSLTKLKRDITKLDGRDTTPARTNNTIKTIENKKGCKPFKPNHRYIVFLNTTFDLGKGKPVPHDPKFKLLNQIPIKWLKDAKCLKFKEFLAGLFEGDPNAKNKIRTLQRMYGHALMGNFRYKNFFFLLGESDCGKSTVMLVLGHILGKENYSGVFLHEFKNQFKLWDLNHKLANLSPEVDPERSIDWTKIKTITGGDAITVDRKFKDGILMKPYATIIASMNNLPKLSETNTSILNRLVLIKFPNIIQEKKQIKNYDEVLFKEEGIGIFMWAVRGYRNLLKEYDRFPVEDYIKKDVKEYILESNPVAILARDHLKKNPNKLTLLMEIHNLYKSFASIRNYPPLNPMKLGNALRALGFESEEKKTNKGRRFYIEIINYTI